MDRIFYTVKEVADKLGLSVFPVREYIKEGKLKAVKLGRQYRVSEDQFNEFIKNNLTGKEEN